MDELGRGAMGIVYRAQDPAIGRTLAIKTMRLSELAEPSERSKLHDRLFREAQSAGSLSHPGIVTIYDIAEEGDVAYIAMEFVDGPSLDRMIQADPPDGTLILSILRQTAAALDYAHARGIVHRDIKPANIIIHNRSTAKITDFGVARIASQQMTHAGSMIGTPNYMSPEQMQAQAVSGASDQFSLAVIAYELLGGERPFAGDSVPALVFKITHGDPAPIYQLNDTLSWAVGTVLKRALSKNPAERYASCTDFVSALENACRASKNWAPAVPAVVPDQPTIGVAAIPSPQPIIEKPLPPPSSSSRFRSDEDERVETPRLLRIGRAIAAMLVALALIVVLWISGRQYFSPDEGESTVAEDTAPTPRLEIRPSPATPESPAAPQPGQPAPQLPGEAVEPPSSEPSSVPGAAAASIKMITNPPGAYIVVDGRSDLSCISPCTLTLGRGRHGLAATKEGFRRTMRILETSMDDEVFLNMDRATGTVVVRSEPAGAQIYVDGQQRSEHTPAVLILPTGNHTIEVVRDNDRGSQQVTVRESGITNLSVRLGAQ
jgi:serine/threonine protein kinase